MTPRFPTWAARQLLHNPSEGEGRKAGWGSDIVEFSFLFHFEGVLFCFYLTLCLKQCAHWSLAVS